MRSARASASCWALEVLGIVKVSASECLRGFSVDGCGGAGTTNDETFCSLELVGEWEVMGKSGGAADWGESSGVVDVGFVDLLLIIFSSMRALTLTLAV